MAIEKISGPISALTRVLGWTLGAASLLNLVQDLGQVAVLGKLKAWLDAYSAFVNVASKILFGWIHISPNQMHVLIVAAIFCSAAAQAEYAFNLSRGWTRPLYGAMMDWLYYFGVIFLPALLLPADFGIFGATLVLIAIGGTVLFNTFPDSASPSAIRREIIGVSTVVLVLVVLNYSIFRTDGG